MSNYQTMYEYKNGILLISVQMTKPIYTNRYPLKTHFPFNNVIIAFFFSLQT